MDKNNLKKPELLAPAGSFEICKAVIFAGADAVYAGGSRFGARAYAQNFTQEQLLEAIDLVHLHKKKLYLTVNTLCKQEEMEALYGYLKPFYMQGLDAVIVQDFGVMRLVREYFPGLSVHISTQMSVASADGFSYLQKCGADRIVTARELSLAEIRQIRSQSELEMECFVHGALCYCYSGGCLLSSMLGGRSGNRGRCAQPCRLPYTVFDEKHRRIAGVEASNSSPSGRGHSNQKEHEQKECYPLSPKDLCTIDQIPELIQAGITSFKIEGRMKSAEYAAGVTAIYRKYIDQYVETGSAEVSRHDYERLLQTGNRSGFTDGYYTRHNGPQMISINRPGHEKSEAADLGFLSEKKLSICGEAFFEIGRPARMEVSCSGDTVSAEHGMTQEAQKQPLSRRMLEEQLSKTGNTPFEMEALTVHLPNQAIFLPKQELNQLRRKAFGQLQEQMLRRYRRSGQGIPEAYENIGAVSKPIVSDSFAEDGIAFTAIAEQEAQLAAVLERDFIKRIYLDSAMYSHEQFTAQLKEHILCIHAAGRQAYLALPPVFRDQTVRFYERHWQDIAAAEPDGYVARTIDELGFLERMHMDKDRCVLDHSLYTYSNETKDCYIKEGWRFDTIPLELNKKELRARDNTQSELIIYGHLPLMTSAQCVKKTFGQCRQVHELCYLKDRYAKEFPVRNVCSECYNTIYNPQPLSLIQLAQELCQLHPAAYRLWFTVETQQEARKVLDSVQAAFFQRKAVDMNKVLGAYTNGHYKRGVE